MAASTSSFPIITREYGLDIMIDYARADRRQAVLACNDWKKTMSDAAMALGH